jgi:hypothetical protein
VSSPPLGSEMQQQQQQQQRRSIDASTRLSIGAATFAGFGRREVLPMKRQSGTGPSTGFCAASHSHRDHDRKQVPWIAIGSESELVGEI